MAETTPKTSGKGATKAGKAPQVKVAKTATPKAAQKTAPKTGSKQPAGKNAATTKKPAASKTATPRKAPTPKAARPAPISDEQRYRMIAEAAYYRAESRQFKSDPLRDWIEAEKDIASLLSEGS